MGAKSQETGTQWKNPSEEKDMSEELSDFWFGFPKSKQLRTKALSRVQQKKSLDYVSSTLNELADWAQKTEAEETNQKRLLELRQQRQLRTRVLDANRFVAEDFVESRLSLPLDKFLSHVPQSWGKDVKILEADLKKKVKRDTYRYRAKIPIPKTKIINKPSKESLEWIAEIKNKLKVAEKTALEQKISIARKRELMANLSDFDILNRPSFFIKLDTQFGSNLKSTESEEETPSQIFSDLKTRISEDSLNTLLRKDLMFPLSSEKFEKKSEKSETKFRADMRKTTDAMKNASSSYELDQFDSFELNSLRDLVNITHDSLRD